jgi:hypothetical protein
VGSIAGVPRDMRPHLAEKDVSHQQDLPQGELGLFAGPSQIVPPPDLGNLGEVLEQCPFSLLSLELACLSGSVSSEEKYHWYPSYSEMALSVLEGFLQNLFCLRQAWYRR